MSGTPGTAQQGLTRSYGWIAMFLIAVGIALYIPLQVLGPLRMLHGNDFKHVYLGMQALTEGTEPYSPESLLLQASLHGLRGASLNPYVYLPFTGLAMAFLKPFGFAAASWIWFALNHVMVLAAAFVMSAALLPDHLRRAQWRGHLFGALLIALALDFPLHRTLTAGQLNCVLLLCLTLAYHALVAGRDGRAGALLGFAAVFKLAPGLFVLHFALRRRWRALAVMCATGAVLMLASVAAVGPRIHLAFLPMLHQMGYGRSTWQEHGATFWKDPTNQSINSLFTHLAVSGNGLTDPWVELEQRHADTATLVATLALVAAFLIVAWWRTRADGDPASHDDPGPELRRDPALFMATVMLMLLIPSLMWDHYLLMAILPAAWLATSALRRGCRAGAALALLLFAATAVPWDFAAPSHTGGLGILLMSMKLFPALGLYAMCLRAALPRAR